jgi:hypothetical protein
VRLRRVVLVDHADPPVPVFVLCRQSDLVSHDVTVLRGNKKLRYKYVAVMNFCKMKINTTRKYQSGSSAALVPTT